MEAALVLPILGLALLGVLFLRQFYAAHDDARRLVRGCALEFAMLGCEPARMPARCAAALSSLQLEQGRHEARGLRDAVDRADRFGVLDLPLISDAIDALFGSATRAHTERGLARPWSDRPAHVAADYAVLCNDQPRDVAAAIERVFCDLVPLVKCR